MPTLTSKQKSRLLRALAVGGLAVVLMGLYVAYFSHGGRGLPCPLLFLTGLKCPACGMTRAVSALLEWNLTAAFEHNALWPLWMGYVLWVAVSNAITYVRSGNVPFLPGQRWLHAAVLAVLIGYGILRNIV